MGRRVWFHEIFDFLFRDERVAAGPTLRELWGEPQDAEEEALLVRLNVVPNAKPNLDTPVACQGADRTV